MNKKGQTLIIFVILIPIMILMLSVITDVGLLKYEALKTKSIVDNGIHFILEQNKEQQEIENLLKLNEIPTENLKVEQEENSIVVELSYKIDSLFGKIIQLNEYEIVIQRQGTIENDKVKITNKE